MRSERAVIALVAGLGIVALSVAGVYVAVAGDSPDATSKLVSVPGLKPLPPGPPREVDSEGVMERTPLPKMIKEATLVFRGRVVAVGGSEVVSPVDETELVEESVHRTRFEVLGTLRGDPVKVVDVTQFDGLDAVPFAVGMTYLVFAEYRFLGTTRTRALVPFGYRQGVFKETSSGRFSNDRNGSVEINDIATRVKEARR